MCHLAVNSSVGCMIAMSGGKNLPATARDFDLLRHGTDVYIHLFCINNKDMVYVGIRVSHIIPLSINPECRLSS